MDLKTNNKMSTKIVRPDSINPVDFYNRNCLDDALNLLTQRPAIELVGNKAITYVKQYADKKTRQLVYDKKTGMFEAEHSNAFGVKVGETISAFSLIQKFVFKDSWREACSYVIVHKMNNDNKYIRIGFDYFKRIKKTDRYGISRNYIKKWKRQELVDDYGREFLSVIDKFDDFTIEPNNKDYKRIVKNCYNMYHPFDHKPMPLDEYTGEEQWKWTKQLISHIFGSDEEHFERGTRYLKLLYDYPMQTLPILVLISKERQTGKSTWINYMSVLFGANTVVINPQDIGNQFNGTYAEKNIIMIEESHFDNRQSLEKIKNLATQKEISTNTKHVAQYSIPFFGKIIITSNDESKFSKIDEEEIRYWVLKIPSLTGTANHQIINDLRDEIPAFLCYLNTLPAPDLTKDRMVFTADEIRTEALVEVKIESREALHKEILIYLDNHAQQNSDIKTFYFTGINLKERFFSHNHRYGIDYINKVLKNNIQFDKALKTMRFVPLENRENYNDKLIGKPYIFENKYYNEVIEGDTLRMDTPEEPF
jgi:hypothetical protein